MDQYTDQLPQASPFTQVVWRASRSYGAGLASGTDGRVYFVARYSPGGNWRDFHANVLPLRDTTSPFVLLADPPTPRSSSSPVAGDTAGLTTPVHQTLRTLALDPYCGPGRGAVGRWTVEDVQRWLAETMLGALAPTFRSNFVDGKALVHLTKRDLKTELDITSLRDRKRLWATVQRLLHGDRPPTDDDDP